MIHWPSILKICSETMKKQVRPLFGSVEAKIGFSVGAGGDIKKQIDLASENALFQTLQEHNVSCTVISEEQGVKQIGSDPSQFYVTVDPVDGTTNAVRGLPFMDISLAVSRKPLLNNVETALVADVLRGITYTAERGKGAYKNGKKIKPSDTGTLEEAVVGVDINTFKARQVVDKLMRILERTGHLRHLGANALEICYVADGTTDAFIDIRGKLRATDIAAAYLILLEAGGIMATPMGEELNVYLDATQRVSFITAANKSIYCDILKLMNARADRP
jgi:myo-inositol-1(or 4)-monophosphatase